MKIINVEKAKTASGLKLGLVAGLPSPWGEAAKGIFAVKGVPFAAVPYGGSGDTAFKEWAGHDSAPVAVYNDEAPRADWTSILLLAERLAPTPALIPADPSSRARLFGYAHEICGEGGLGWCARQAVIDGGMTETNHPLPADGAAYFAGKYGYFPDGRSEALQRVRDVLDLLSTMLDEQASMGSSYLLGDSLTALDIYAATFLVFVAPWSPAECAMPEFLRGSFAWVGEQVADAVDDRLLRHRDHIYADHLQLPIELI